MADIYVNLSYEEYKELEYQCRKFQETSHGKGTDWYHKSFRMKIAGTIWEFHGPNVKAREIHIRNCPCEDCVKDRSEGIIRTVYDREPGGGLSKEYGLQ